jgi:hypothetical protein
MKWSLGQTNFKTIFLTFEQQISGVLFVRNVKNSKISHPTPQQ